MTNSFLRYFVSFDVFGQPISINYRGRETFQTALGALVTLGLYVFLLTYSMMSVLGALDFQDPKITQYTIFNARDDGTKYNFGELYGSFTFGFVSQTKFGFPEPDPRIGYWMLENRRFGSFEGSSEAS